MTTKFYKLISFLQKKNALGNLKIPPKVHLKFFKTLKIEKIIKFYAHKT